MTSAVLCIIPYWNTQYWMMTSSNGRIFLVTDHLCREFTGHRSNFYSGTDVRKHQSSVSLVSFLGGWGVGVGGGWGVGWGVGWVVVGGGGGGGYQWPVNSPHKRPATIMNCFKKTYMLLSAFRITSRYWCSASLVSVIRPYGRLTPVFMMSTPWLLMPWWRKEPSHQRLLYWDIPASTPEELTHWRPDKIVDDL